MFLRKSTCTNRHHPAFAVVRPWVSAIPPISVAKPCCHVILLKEWRFFVIRCRVIFLQQVLVKNLPKAVFQLFNFFQYAKDESMKIFSRFLQKIIAPMTIVVLLRCCAAYAQTGVPIPSLAHVDVAVVNFMQQWNLPGGSVAIGKDGRLVYARGFGFANRETNELVQPQHRFRIASVSKPITSAAIMKLLEAGRVRLADKVFGTQGILNDPVYATIRDVRALDITIQHLLQHTAGWNLYVSGDPMFKALEIAQAMSVSPPPAPATIIRYMLARQLDFAPGTQFQYSNFGFLILGRVIEKLSGMSYEEYVKTAILQPTGAVGFKLGKNLLEDRAENEVKYYDFPGAPFERSVYGTGALVPRTYSGFNLEAMDAHGGWIASATDLLRFLVAVDGFSSKPDILSQSSINIMTKTTTPHMGFYAFGWETDPGRNNWWHNGALAGASALMYRRNDGVAWTVLFNSWPQQQNFSTALATMIFTAVNAVQNWPAHDLFNAQTSVEETPSINSFRLLQNFPNPFNPTTNIAYSIPRAASVQLGVYNFAGQRVCTLVNQQQREGSYVITWDGKNDAGAALTSGVYVYRLQAGEFLQSGKMILLR